MENEKQKDIVPKIRILSGLSIQILACTGSNAGIKPYFQRRASSESWDLNQTNTRTIRILDV